MSASVSVPNKFGFSLETFDDDDDQFDGREYDYCLASYFAIDINALHTHYVQLQFDELVSASCSVRLYRRLLSNGLPAGHLDTSCE